MPETKKFSTDHMDEVKRATCEAERLVSSFYCIPGREWDKYGFDIKTEAEIEEGLAGSSRALAQLFKSSVMDVKRGMRKEFFSIQLFDGNIMDSAAGAGGEKMLPPLLLYVMTHEILHVIRFFSYPENFWLDAEWNREEEARVHGLTKRILLPESDRKTREIIERLERRPVPFECLRGPDNR